jgi:plasmid maintenance system killer protein
VGCDASSSVTTAADCLRLVEKVRNIVSFLQDMGNADELKAMPLWRAHRLSGDRRGRWSLTVSRNWRITFVVDEKEGEIVDLDFEDYH